MVGMYRQNQQQVEQQIVESVVKKLAQVRIEQRRSWPPTGSRQQSSSSILPIANGSVLEEIKKTGHFIQQELDKRLAGFMTDKRKSDREREEEKKTRRRQEAYHTEMCRAFTRHGNCQYGDECRFAHHESQLAVRQQHRNYKTKLCRNFTQSGYCIYGPRCQFIHRSPQRPVHPFALSAINFDAVANNPQAVNWLTAVPQSPLWSPTLFGYAPAFAYSTMDATATSVSGQASSFYYGHGHPVYAASTPTFGYGGDGAFPFPPHLN